MRVLYMYKENDLLNPFINRQIKEAALDVASFLSIPIDGNPTLVEAYDIVSTHTLIFKNMNHKELYRFEGPFSAGEIKQVMEALKTMAAGVKSL